MLAPPEKQVDIRQKLQTKPLHSCRQTMATFAFHTYSPFHLCPHHRHILTHLPTSTATTRPPPSQYHLVSPCRSKTPTCALSSKDDNKNEQLAATTTSRRDKVMQEVMSNLKETLPDILDPKIENDYSKYSAKVSFEDPLTKFNGVKRHAGNVDFLSNSFLFKNTVMVLHDTQILPPITKSSFPTPTPDVIRTRWTMYMTVDALKWKPRLYFTGISDYFIDVNTEKIVRHADYWDSLIDEENSYFSITAMKQVVKMCSPSYPVPTDVLPEFTLLRNLPTYQIWRFNSDIVLAPLLQPNSLSVYSISTSLSPPPPPSDNSESVRIVAVVPLSSKLPSKEDMSKVVADISEKVKKASYATLGTRSFCVRLNRDSSDLYHVWLELTDARTDATLDWSS